MFTVHSVYMKVYVTELCTVCTAVDTPVHIFWVVSIEFHVLNLTLTTGKAPALGGG